jgi:hypothetical protein
MEKVAENGWKAKAIIIINKLYLHDLIKKITETIWLVTWTLTISQGLEMGIHRV